MPRLHPSSLSFKIIQKHGTEKTVYESMDDLFDQMKASRPTPKMVNLIYYMIIIHMLILYNFSKVMMDQR